jgi:hypothetical protein
MGQRNGSPERAGRRARAYRFIAVGCKDGKHNDDEETDIEEANEIRV